MQLVTEIRELRDCLHRHRVDGSRIGFVPTMGYFHDGHLSLMKEARRSTDVVVVSVFVNPLQFGPTEDFQTYPRDMERDAALAQSVGVDYLFVPTAEQMYPPPALTSVKVKGLSDVLCGKSRPGHFQGVATVVSKLFNIVQPDIAFFGRKDYQQLKVIERMVEDLNIPVEIRAVDTVRESDGLAMSSRNVRLSPSERKAALSLSRSLRTTAGMISEGVRDVSSLIQEGLRLLTEEPLVDVDYFEIRDAETLEEVEIVEHPVVIAVAAKIGETRLIDNELVDIL